MNHHRMLRRSFLGAISLGAAVRPAFSAPAGSARSGSIHAVGNFPVAFPVSNLIRSDAAAINDHGQVAVSAYIDGVGQHAFFWDGGSSPVDLGVLPGHLYSTAYGIN